MSQVGRPGMLALAVLLALALALGGCGSGAPPASSSTEQAKVKGKLTLKGNPLGKVEVRFDASNINRTATAMAVTNDDGSYEVTTVVGENTITLGGPGASQHSKELTYFNKLVEVTSGENTVDITIP
jgi:hypothetical protein